MRVYWRGPDTLIEYGLDQTYGMQATASQGTITPVDTTGPFQQVKLTGLQPGTTYHYRIGLNGPDYSFKTPATGDFTWSDIGDTGTSYYDQSTPSNCDKFWMPSMWQQVAADDPDFVFHGGDISYANECGEPAVHAFWNDIAPVSTKAAMQFSWGNHEYGSPSSTAPAGTPRDSMANYKGRYRMSNAQIVPNDTPSKTTHPGCPSGTSNAQNGCYGNDWGYFTVGHVLFIGAPEPWVNAYADWQQKADALMAAAQLDPNIYFVVTQAHRPAYSSISNNGGQADYRSAVDALGDKYSPSARPDGKYVLNVGHHVHGAEVFAPQHGVVHITNVGGGTKLASIRSLSPGSIWKQDHFGYMRTNVSDNTMKIEIVCGQIFPLNTGSDPCDAGSVIYATTLSGYKAGPALPKVTTTVTDTKSTAVSGELLEYTVTAASAQTETPVSGASLSLNLPQGVAVTDSDGGALEGSTVAWQLPDLVPSQPVTHTVKAALTTASVGDVLTAQANLLTPNNECANQASACTASDSTSVVSPGTEYLSNRSFEIDISGWSAYNSGTTLARTTLDWYEGIASAKLTAASGSTTGITSRSQAISSVGGKIYVANAWVRSNKSSETLRLQIREVRSDGTQVSQKSVDIVSDGTWQNIQQTFTALGSGNKLIFNVFTPTYNAGEWLQVDQVSLLAN